MIVTRDEFSFDVVPAVYPFWERDWPSWEPETFETIRRFVHGGTYLDVGAWIGPTVLYASKFACYVVAVEPDPVACSQLWANVAANPGCPVHIHDAAMGTEPGAVQLHGAVGDSMASMVTGRPGPSRTVRTVTWVEVTASLVDVQLVKMDIEGAEETVIPSAAGWLADHPTPLWLSLHRPYWHGDGAALFEALAGYDLSFQPGRPPGWDEILAVPR